MTNEQIDYSIETNELQLTGWEKFSHYAVVGAFFFISTVIIFLYFNGFTNDTSKNTNGIIVMFFISLSLGFLFYRLQRGRLKFKIVETNLTRDELDKIIKNVSIFLRWEIFKSDKKIVVAKTSPDFFSGSYGEQITILFDKQRVFVNSICDPNKKSSVVSMGRNKKNTSRLINEIEKASC